MIKGVLFDMDGVLIDSEKLTAEAAIRHFAKKGYKVTQKDFYPFYGTGEKGYFLGVANKFGIPFDLDTEKYQIYDLYFDMAKKNRLSVMNGVSEFILKCKELNLKLSVATSAGKYKMDKNLELINIQQGVFDALVCGDDITHNKPNPEIYLKAANELGLPTEQCMVVEDALEGIKAGKAAGCTSLGVLSSFEYEALEKADYVVSHLRYAIEILDRLNVHDKIIN